MKKGFTLIELIMVITLLSILLTIAFISLGSYTEHAKNMTNQEDGTDLYEVLDSDEYDCIQKCNAVFNFSSERNSCKQSCLFPNKENQGV